MDLAKIAYGAVLHGRLQMLFELWRRGSCCVLLPVTGAYVPNHGNCHANYGDETGDRDDVENQHLQKDNKAGRFPCILLPKWAVRPPEGQIMSTNQVRAGKAVDFHLTLV